jgi:VWFA-related protein
MRGYLAAAVAAALSIRQPVFQTETRLVVLHATVRNGHGELVTNLDRGAFTAYEDGKPQPIMLFSRDDLPVSLGLLIDNSGSMRSIRATVEAAALAFARASNPDDEMFVLNFADKAHIDVPFTSDVRVLEAGIARVDSIGGTAMRDAVGTAEDYLRRSGHKDRKVLLVITDGNDNASQLSLQQIEQQAEQQEIVVYAIGLTGDATSMNRMRADLDRLTERTGGVAYYPASVEDVDAAALTIARQIRTQYTIAYAPINQTLDRTYRKIRLVASASEKLVVRTRTGYRASASITSEK